MYYGNVWSMCERPYVMVNVTKNIPPDVDDEGNRLIATYSFENLALAEKWYWIRERM